MHTKSLFLLLVLSLCNVLTYAQENEGILSTPDNWKREIIAFPLGFAPSIDFVGYEDLRFAPGWSDRGSQEFWSYSFAWYIELDTAMTEQKLTEAFCLYYDGLMGVDMQNPADTNLSARLDKTSCEFIRTQTGFSGKMKVYDAFFTKDYMTLNIRVKEYFCRKTNKQIIVCDISPKAFDHAVWRIFDQVKLRLNCED